MSANLKAFSNASSKGLQTTGVFGSTVSESGRRVYSQKSKISLPTFSLEVMMLSDEFRVSKLIILSKQSSSPSLLSTLVPCLVSALVKSCKRETNKYISHMHNMIINFFPIRCYFQYY